MSSQDAVVIHGDLNPRNILRSRRQPWLAIDPEPMVGAPAFDPAALLAEIAPLANDADLRRRYECFATLTGIAVDRMASWPAARFVHAALRMTERDQGHRRRKAACSRQPHGDAAWTPCVHRAHEVSPVPQREDLGTSRSDPDDKRHGPFADRAEDLLEAVPPTEEEERFRLAFGRHLAGDSDHDNMVTAIEHIRDVAVDPSYAVIDARRAGRHRRMSDTHELVTTALRERATYVFLILGEHADAKDTVRPDLRPRRRRLRDTEKDQWRIKRQRREGPNGGSDGAG